MDSNQARIIELLREVHLIALKEIERLNQNGRIGSARPPNCRSSPKQPATYRPRHYRSALVRVVGQIAAGSFAPNRIARDTGSKASTSLTRALNSASDETPSHVKSLALHRAKQH
jgi:hypothetical protein